MNIIAALRNNKLIFTIAAVGLLLYLPAFFYSINTGPALIDDYADAGYSAIFASFESFCSFIAHSLNYHNTGRWRPFYEFDVGIRWQVFGQEYSLHRIFRMAMRIALSLFSAGVVPLLIGKWKHGRLIQIALFFTVLLFPNNPEARLAPQELPLVLFLSAFYYGVISCYICEPSDRTDSFMTQILWIIVPALGMVSSKEPGFVLVPPAILTIIASNRPALRKYSIAFILLIITGWCYLRLSAESGHLEYSANNGALGTYVSYVFNPFRSRIWMAVFCGAFAYSLVAMGRRSLSLGYKNDPWTRVFFLMLAGYLLYSYLILMIPNLCNRYSFPVSWFTLMLLLLPVCCAKDDWGNKFIGRGFFLLWALFMLLMYHNYIYQFYSHYRLRKGEQSLIESVVQIQRSGGEVWLENSDEVSNSLNIAFSEDFSGRFALNRTPFKLIGDGKKPPLGSYVVNPSNTNSNDSEEFLPIATPVSGFYKTVARFHSILSLGSAQDPLFDCASPKGVEDTYGRIIKIGGKL